MKPLNDLSDDELARLARRAAHELSDAPAWLVESAMAMWRAPAAATPGPAQRLLALLRFDNWAVSPTLALRSAVPAAHQLLYSAGGHDIDLRIAPSAAAAVAPPARFVVAGQVLGPGEGGEVALRQGGQVLARAALDDFGEFRFADVAAAACVITLHVGDVVIELPEFDVGGEAPG